MRPGNETWLEAAKQRVRDANADILKVLETGVGIEVAGKKMQMAISSLSTAAFVAGYRPLPGLSDESSAADASNVTCLPLDLDLNGDDFGRRLAEVRLCYYARGCAATPEVGLACVSIDWRGRTYSDTRGLDQRTAGAMLDAVARLYWRVHNVAHGHDEHARPSRRRLVPPKPATT